MRTINRLLLPLACAIALRAGAQTPPAPPAADTPSFKIGATVFTDYTFVTAPVAKDSDGNEIHPQSFNLSRAYINVTGQLNHYLQFRITPDVTRETGSGSSLNGSQTFRLKYGYAQLNLDDWATKGSWLRLGMQQTPLIDYSEAIYRYRFQGSIFVDREGYLSSSDVGLSGHYNFAGDYGDVHAGVYNGEGYNKAETNDQKSLQVRATLRPLPRSALGKGLRVTVFFNGDHTVNEAVRKRLVQQVTYEHPRFAAGFDHLSTKDQSSATAPTVSGDGWSVWLNPRLGKGWELLLRHDEMKPDDSRQQLRRRNIAGVAYWLPNLQKVSSSILLDYDVLQQQDYSPGRPDDSRIGVKLLVQF